MPSVSIVVPVRRDAAALTRLLEFDFGDAQIIVAATKEDEAALAPLRAVYRSADWVLAARGRAAQMNAAAGEAAGDWIVFLHADTRLPAVWREAIEAAEAAGCVGGCFRFALDDPGWRARAITWGVRIRVALCGLPYGDQALFVRRDMFRALEGYSAMPIMEDVDFVRRLKRRGRIFRSPLAAVTSARRWRSDGWLRRTAANIVLILLFYAGVSPLALARADARVRKRRDE